MGVAIAAMRPAGAPKNGTQDVVWATNNALDLIFKSVDGGVTFSSRSLPPASPQPNYSIPGSQNDFYTIWVDPLNGDNVLVGGSRRVGSTNYNPVLIKTTDGFVSDKQYLPLTGINPTTVTAIIQGIKVTDFNGRIAITKTAIAAEATRSIFDVSLDGGLTWQNKELNFFGVNNGNMKLSMPSLTGYLTCFSNITSTGGAMKKTTNGGETWVGQTAVAGQHRMTCMHFPSDNIGFISGTGPVFLAKTIDGGLNWNALTVAGMLSTDAPTQVKFFNNLIGYLWTQSTSPNASKVWKTIDGGVTWSQETTPWIALNGAVLDAAIIQDIGNNPSNGNRVFGRFSGTGYTVVRRGS